MDHAREIDTMLFGSWEKNKAGEALSSRNLEECVG